MSINREFWLRPFSEDYFPNWICPRCETGVLRPIEKTFLYEESGDVAAERLRHGEYFNYDVYTFRYSVLLKCNNSNCQERVSSCGQGYVQEDFVAENGKLVFDQEGGPRTDMKELFIPEYFYPLINIFSVPKKCPEEVTNEIKSSFKLFFADPPASANYIRKAIEAILTDKKVKRVIVNHKGKKVPVNLHNRIVEFEKSKPDIAKKLFAIKWLGNEGSHTGKMTSEDVLDAYEILEVVIEELYVGQRRLIDKKVSRINKSKKPLSQNY